MHLVSINKSNLRSIWSQHFTGWMKPLSHKYFNATDEKTFSLNKGFKSKMKLEDKKKKRSCGRLGGKSQRNSWLQATWWKSHSHLFASKTPWTTLNSIICSLSLASFVYWLCQQHYEVSSRLFCFVDIFSSIFCLIHSPLSPAIINLRNLPWMLLWMMKVFNIVFLHFHNLLPHTTVRCHSFMDIILSLRLAFLASFFFVSSRRFYFAERELLIKLAITWWDFKLQERK